MHITYHLSSAQEITADLLDNIKANLNQRPLLALWKKNDSNEDLDQGLKAILNERLQEDESI